MYVCVCTCAHACTGICIHICLYIYMYIYMYIYPMFLHPTNIYHLLFSRKCISFLGACLQLWSNVYAWPSPSAIVVDFSSPNSLRVTYVYIYIYIYILKFGPAQASPPVQLLDVQTTPLGSSLDEDMFGRCTESSDQQLKHQKTAHKTC